MTRLTRRYREVAVCLMLGLTTREIASRLGLSPRTVETYTLRLRTAFGARSNPHLVFKLFSGEERAGPICHF